MDEAVLLMLACSSIFTIRIFFFLRLATAHQGIGIDEPAGVALSPEVGGSQGAHGEACFSVRGPPGLLQGGLAAGDVLGGQCGARAHLAGHQLFYKCLKQA